MRKDTQLRYESCLKSEARLLIKLNRILTTTLQHYPLDLASVDSMMGSRGYKEKKKMDEGSKKFVCFDCCPYNPYS